MIEPLQAQIEAARLAIANAIYSEVGTTISFLDDALSRIAEAALTAAAEVGPKLDDLVAGITEENRHPESFAAEVGEPPPYITQPGDPTFEGGAAYEAYQKALDYCDNATIERCAQKCDDGTECGQFYAAAIRALKDE